MNGYQSLFKKEIQNYLYPFLWQHGESRKLLESYIDKIHEAKMNAICIEARPHPDFVGEKWWKDVDTILQKLKEKNMKMWILDDSHFPTGYANGRVKKDFPQYLKLYIQCRRYDIQGPLTKARIDFSLLKGRIWDKPEEDIEILGVYMAKRILKGNQDKDPIDASTLIDITSNMKMDSRLLHVDVPKGAYSIFVVFETKHGEEDATKDYLNPLVKEATQVLIDEVYEPHYEHYKEEFGKTILGFFSDEPRFGNAKGTQCTIGMDMPLPWRKGLEKELAFDRKYLPLLWTDAKGKESEIRFLYMDLITNLYNENFTNVLSSWCQEHAVWYLGHTIEDNGAHARLGYGTGHYFRGQEGMHMAGIDVIGTQIVPGMNYHHDAFSSGGSNGEFYHYALAKLGSSAAHLDEKKEGRLMCEAFGAYGWNEGLKMMKWIADSLIVRGVNYIVPHAFNPNKFPDWDCPPHFYAHGHNPQFRYYHVLDDYMNRMMSMFREGVYPTCVGVLYPAEMEWSGDYMPIEKPAKELTMHQISFDILSRDYLKKAQIQNGTYIINKAVFEVLVCPYGEYIPADIIDILDDCIRHHIQVIFLHALPKTVLGKYDETKWEVIRTKSKVIPLTKLGYELQSYACVKTLKREHELVVGEYIRDDMHIYMMFNESTYKTINTSIDFKEKGYIYRYDAFKDTLTRVSTPYLHLMPYESTIFIVSKRHIDTMEERDISYKDIQIEQEWSVSYADSFSYPTFTKIPNLNTLGYVHESKGFENICGTLQYCTEIEINTVSHARLEIEHAYETVEVFINDKSVGVRLCEPYVFELEAFAHKGMNKLCIEVTNTLGTQVRDALSHYLAIEPFGMEGPITLKVEKSD